MRPLGGPPAPLRLPCPYVGPPTWHRSGLCRCFRLLREGLVDRHVSVTDGRADPQHVQLVHLPRCYPLAPGGPFNADTSPPPFERNEEENHGALNHRHKYRRYAGDPLHGPRTGIQRAEE